MGRARRLMPDQRWAEIAIVLTDHDGIRPLNLAHFGEPGTTDVISFRYDPLPGERDSFSGDIVLNVEIAVERAQRSGQRTESGEVALYVAHGCDHLTGQDDSTGPERRRMRDRENRWLRAARAQGLTAALIVG